MIVDRKSAAAGDDTPEPEPEPAVNVICMACRGEGFVPIAPGSRIFTVCRCRRRSGE